MTRSLKRSAAFVLASLCLLSACADTPLPVPESSVPSGAEENAVTPTPTPTQLPEPVPTPEPEVPSITVPQQIRLEAAEHPELDFTCDEYGNPFICDFCITDEGTLLILQLSEKIYEYSFDGELLGTYDLHLKDNGLSAHRIAAGADGRLYLVDGRNNSIITATRDGVENLSYAGILNDVGLLSRFYCVGDALIATYEDIEEQSSKTAVLDVGGSEVALIRNWTGVRVTEELSFSGKTIPSDGKFASDSFVLYIYRENVLSGEYLITTQTEGTSIFGLELLSADSSGFLAKICEYVPDTKSGKTAVKESLVYLDTEELRVKVPVPAVEFNGAQRYSDNKCYLFAVSDDALTITDLFSACGQWEDAEYSMEEAR